MDDLDISRIIVDKEDIINVEQNEDGSFEAYLATTLHDHNQMQEILDINETQVVGDEVNQTQVVRVGEDVDQTQVIGAANQTQVVGEDVDQTQVIGAADQTQVVGEDVDQTQVIGAADQTQVIGDDDDQMQVIRADDQMHLDPWIEVAGDDVDHTQIVGDATAQTQVIEAADLMQQTTETFEDDYDNADRTILQELGSQLLDAINCIESEKDRIHLMAIVVNGSRIHLKRTDISQLLKRSVCNREIAMAKRHSLYPGPGRVLKKSSFKHFRRRLKDEAVGEFIEWLYAGDLLQNLAYGQKIVQYSNGIHIPLESVQRNKCINEIMKLYAETWIEEGLAMSSNNKSYAAITSCIDGGRGIDDGGQGLDSSADNSTDSIGGSIARGLAIAGAEGDIDGSIGIAGARGGIDHGSIGMAGARGGVDHSSIGKVARARGGVDHGGIDSSDRSDMGSIIDGEEEEIINDIQNHGRCEKTCKKTGTFCLKEKGHLKSCRFTPKGKLSPSTVEKILKGLTSGDLKSLRGLDNIAVEKGDDNFEKMKSIIRSLAMVGQYGSLEACPQALKIIQKIDEIAQFHKVEFPRHLVQGGSTHTCGCMKCGFHCSEDTGAACGSIHRGQCKLCTDSFNIFIQMLSFHREVKERLHSIGNQQWNLALEDDLLSWEKDIEQCLRNLLDFRAHVAQREDESSFDARRYKNLKPNEAIVIMDYKMKILASKFREKQSDWFSKRGFSCLGALIIFGSSLEDAENEVLYHFFISDDTTQDSEAINCAKHFLYKNVLPKMGIDTVHYRCDGAGAFDSLVAKAAMGRWMDLTCSKLKETTYKVMVPGCGKTNLDGMFGVLTRHLNRLIDSGNSFKNAEELYQLLVTHPLNHSEFHLFLPNRKLLDWNVNAKLMEKLGDFYLIEHDKTDRMLKGAKHSQHSSGTMLPLLEAHASHDPTLKKEIEEIKNMTVKKLRSELSKDHLDLKGTKATLVQRLMCHCITKYKSTYTHRRNQEKRLIEIPNPNAHIIASTLDKRDPNGNTRSHFSKIGWRERIKKRQDEILHQKNKHVSSLDRDEVERLEELGLLSCPAIDEFGNRCLHKFSSRAFLDRHLRKREGKPLNEGHTFPSHNSMDELVRDVQNGKFALCLACGTMSNRDSAMAGQVEIDDYDGDDLYESMKNSLHIPSFFNSFKKTGCYRRDNKSWKKKPFRASKALDLDLEYLFLEGENRDNVEGTRKKNASKYTPEQAVAVLANMLNPDGSRKYSYRDGNPNGPLPTVAFVKARFSARKNGGAKTLVHGRRENEVDEFEEMQIMQLKEKCKEVFGHDILYERNALVRLLVIDDQYKYGGTDEDLYAPLNLGSIKLECRNRSLPQTVDEAALRIILRAHFLESNPPKDSASNEIEAAIAITEGFETRGLT